MTMKVSSIIHTAYSIIEGGIIGYMAILQKQNRRAAPAVLY